MLHELPQRWIWTNISEIAFIEDHLRKPVNSSERQRRIKDKDKSELFPYYGATGQVGFIDDFITDSEYILIGEDGAPFLDPLKDKAYGIKGKTWVNNHAHILKANKFFNQRFLLHYLNQFDYNNYVNGTTRLKLTKSSLTTIPVPLPPLNEQLRIVEKIEELFSELENGVEDLELARGQLKTYRQGILKWAFEGKLTNKSVLGSKIPKEWTWVKLNEITKSISDGDHQAPPKSQKGIPFITISNINKTNNKIDFSNTFTVSIEYFNNLKEHRKPQKGDILYTVTGSFGIPVLIDYDKSFCFQRHIGLIRPINNINPKWLFYLLQSPQLFRQGSMAATGTAQKTIALNSLRNFDIPLCSQKEQDLIVLELESRLTICDKIEEDIEVILNPI